MLSRSLKSFQDYDKALTTTCTCVSFIHAGILGLLQTNGYVMKQGISSQMAPILTQQCWLPFILLGRRKSHASYPDIGIPSSHTQSPSRYWSAYPIQTAFSGAIRSRTNESSAALCIDAKVRSRAEQLALAALQLSGGEKTPKHVSLPAKKERPGGQWTGRVK